MEGYKYMEWGMILNGRNTVITGWLFNLLKSDMTYNLWKLKSILTQNDGLILQFGITFLHIHPWLYWVDKHDWWGWLERIARLH